MSTKFEEICQSLTELLDPLGLECHPFKIGWYNQSVGKAFRLNLPEDGLAFIIMSTPNMFEKAFKPFVWRQDCTGPGDVLDKCMSHYFTVIREKFPETSVEFIHDFEFHPSRRPKILVQTAGHVAGAVYYYQRVDVKNDPWGPDKQIYGVSIHPKYGGWFAFRGVFIFKDILMPDLEQKQPPDVVPDQQKRIELLEQFNFHYTDWQFRDIISPTERYSEQQKKYFSTMPGERGHLIQEILDEKQPDDGSCP